MSEIQDLIRAIALDRAYQIAGWTCRWCGLPAVRTFEGLKACPSCVPPQPQPSDGIILVEHKAELVALDAKAVTESFASERALPHVFVRSIGRFFDLFESRMLRNDQPDGAEQFASSDPAKLWCIRFADCDFEPKDLPNRKAVERLLRIARVEP